MTDRKKAAIGKKPGDVPSMSMPGPEDRAGQQGYSRRSRGEPAPGDEPSERRGPALLDLQTHWAALNAIQKLRCKQAGVAVGILILGYGLYTASTGSKAPTDLPPSASKMDMGAGLRGDSLEVKMRGDLKKILDGQKLLSRLGRTATCRPRFPEATFLPIRLLPTRAASRAQAPKPCHHRPCRRQPRPRHRRRR